MSDDQPQSADETDPSLQQFREIGSEMGLNSLVAHLYRGEMDRVSTWRQRLDKTTNFAVTVMGAIIAYAFAGKGAGHMAIIAGMIIGLAFLFIESHRFRQYDIWRSRVRTLQENLFANALDPSAGVEHRDWRKQLSKDYRKPTQKMSFRTAVAHRLRRVYLPLLIGLFAVWVFHLAAYGTADGVIASAAIENVPGHIVMAIVIGGYALLIALALLTDIKTETGPEDHGDIDAWRS